MFSPLLALPLEVAELILTFAHPTDVARVSQTCHKFYDVIYKADQYLWRTLYLSYPFDHPALCSELSEQTTYTFNWQEELQRRVSAEIYISRSREFSPKLGDALETLLHVVATAADHSHAIEDSSNLSWVSRILGSSSVLTLANDTLDDRTRSLRAHLRSYLALSYDETPLEQSETLRALRLQSRCYIYSLTNYGTRNRWGPFLINSEGHLTPDWVHIDHIVNIMIFNIRDRANQDVMVETMLNAGPSNSISVDNDLCPKWNLQMTRAYSAPRSSERKPRDWAGAEGTWRRFLSLMDYRELFAFNYSSFGHGARDPQYWNNGIVEGLRDTEMILTLVDGTIAPEPLEDPAYPPLMYKGIARSRTGPAGMDVDIKGVVRRYLNGAIRWTFLTFFEGVRQWSAEGIQLGNICSAAGIAGIWTGAEHQVGDPVGPFLMYKVADPLRPFKV